MRLAHPIAHTIRTLGCLLAVAPLLCAQQPGADATIRGRVVDPQRRGITAHVQVVQPSTDLTRDTDADASGHFAVTNLAPGTVNVIVTAPAFATRRIEGLTLAVGGAVDVDIELLLSGGQESVTVGALASVVDVLSSSVGAVISAREIDSLPLNGRNFLELALLTPGNAPAPNFDPTKGRSVVVSSAGQMGRGGNVTIDGMDNNDDVVGGPLLNLTQDAVQEFRVATNGFSAELGRSAGSVINVVTKSGSDDTHGTAAVFLRDRAWQSSPATLESTLADDMPFRRQQVPFTFGGPLRRQRLFGFAALEWRNEDGGVLVGSRNTASRTIARTFAVAPLDDLLGTARVDWRAAGDTVTLRYSGQREDDISASKLDRAIGTASYRQQSRNRLHAVLGSWTRILSPRAVNAFSASVSDFSNAIVPVEPGVQMTFPSMLAGSSFRVPQATTQSRLQISDAVSLVRGTHQWKMGGQWQRVSGVFDLDVFRNGRIELIEDFPAFDRNGDGTVNDDDLLFAVTLRSGNPDRGLSIAGANSMHVAGYVQDDWRVHPRLTINAGLRYEVDTDVNNQSRVGELNPIVAPLVTEDRRRDLNNWGPRLGFNWSTPDARTSIRGGYGIYYDRVTLQIQSLERGLDGRALPIEVRAGNLLFMDQTTGRLPPGAPSVSNPFTGFILPGAGASGINIIDPRLQNPKVQQSSIGIERQIGSQTVRADVVYNRGSDFIIGRTIGTVFNPVVGGPDRVVNLESSARTEYQALLLSYDRRVASRLGLRAAYTLSSARNYANDDQIPFSTGPIDPNDLPRENGPAPNDQRHRLVASGVIDLWRGIQVAALWTAASGVPMDILMPDGQSRVPLLARNAGGRQFKTGADLNTFIRGVNATGGINGEPLPLVADTARFNDSFSAIDLRVSKALVIGGTRVQAIAEVFNVLNTTNVLGTSNLNYSGYANVLARDSSDPASAGYQRASQFGTPVSTAGGVFGTGGPRALQLAARVSF